VIRINQMQAASYYESLGNLDNVSNGSRQRSVFARTTKVKESMKKGPSIEGRATVMGVRQLGAKEQLSPG
jgi:hypothetical protein